MGHSDSSWKLSEDILPDRTVDRDRRGGGVFKRDRRVGQWGSGAVGQLGSWGVGEWAVGEWAVGQLGSWAVGQLDGGTVARWHGGTVGRWDGGVLDAVVTLGCAVGGFLGNWGRAIRFVPFATILVCGARYHA